MSLSFCLVAPAQQSFRFRWKALPFIFDKRQRREEKKKHRGMFSQKKGETKQQQKNQYQKYNESVFAFVQCFLYKFRIVRFFPPYSLFTLSSNLCFTSALIFGRNSCLMQIDSKMLSWHEWNWRSDVSLLTASIYQISIEIPFDDLVVSTSVNVQRHRMKRLY